MAVERFYIYRRGDTSACVLSRTKDSSALPPAETDQWNFWMQITCNQFDDGSSGFAFTTAIPQIEEKGYFLFTASRKLLEKHHPRGSEGPSNV